MKWMIILVVSFVIGDLSVETIETGRYGDYKIGEEICLEKLEEIKKKLKTLPIKLFVDGICIGIER